MKKDFEWNYTFPKKQDCSKLVIATLINLRDEIFVNEVFINENGQFMTWDYQELESRVIAWSHYPEPATDAPF